MDYQSEQRLAAWTDRRDGETRAAMASRSSQLPWHAYRGDDTCPLCGKMGPHGEKEVSRA